MRIAEAWAYGRARLAATSGQEGQQERSPDLDARLLLQHVTGFEHSMLIAHGDDELAGDQWAAFQDLLEQAARKAPIPYLTGKAYFRDLVLQVTPAVLIPRPETEQLVDLALAWAEEEGGVHYAVDVGTGSGCIAISLALALPGRVVAATDIAGEALALAQANARQCGAENIQFLQGHLLAPVVFRPDLIVANLPYVADDEWSLVDDAVQWYEPLLALNGGPDGLVLIADLLRQAAIRLRSGGAIFLEIGWRQGPEVVKLARQSFPAAEIAVVPDLMGHDRYLVIKTPSGIRDRS
jgi:release factor glutamine methyltransferase